MNDDVQTIIINHDQLVELARALGVRPDWHEPDEQNVTARVEGNSFDNAGFWPTYALPFTAPESIEQHVIISKEGHDVAIVNLATLLAWASEPRTVPTTDTEAYWRDKISNEVHDLARKLTTNRDAIGGAVVGGIIHDVARAVRDVNRVIKP